MLRMKRRDNWTTEMSRLYSRSKAGLTTALAERVEDEKAQQREIQEIYRSSTGSLPKEVASSELGL